MRKCLHCQIRVAPLSPLVFKFRTKKECVFVEQTQLQNEFFSKFVSALPSKHILKTHADTLVLQILYYIVAALGSPYQGEHDPDKELSNQRFMDGMGTKLKQLNGYSYQSKISAVDHDFFEGYNPGHGRSCDELPWRWWRCITCDVRRQLAPV